MDIKREIIYEVNVNGFFDSNNDGFGDFEGVTQKLDYIRDLGVTTIWFMPVMKTPGYDDGYDVSDYYSTRDTFGSNADFKRLVEECHKRNLKVMIDFVANHTSREHVWFQEALKGRDNPYHDFYIWSDTAEEYLSAPVLFSLETSNWEWDENLKRCYFHRFYKEQPDLNYRNPKVKEEVIRIIDFWLSDMNVDALRMDAVPFLWKENGTNCESLPETHQILKDIRAHTDKKYNKQKYLLCEATLPTEILSDYLKDDEMQLGFNFDLMTTIYMAFADQDPSLIENLILTQKEMGLSLKFAAFLRSHDGLITFHLNKEKKELMYKNYTISKDDIVHGDIVLRLSNLLKGDKRKILLMYSLLFALPGVPVLYYGDEIGLKNHENVKTRFRDRRAALRGPMFWSSNADNGGFTRNPNGCFKTEKKDFVISNPSEYEEPVLTVEDQDRDENSLLKQIKNMIKSYRQYMDIFCSDDFEFLPLQNKHIMCFRRNQGKGSIFCFFNIHESSSEFDFMMTNKQSTGLREKKRNIHLPPFGYSLIHIDWESVKETDIF